MALLRRDRAPAATGDPHTMLPERHRQRSTVERGFMRLVATTGIVGIGVLLGAVLVSNTVQGWITGLVVAVVSVVLAALLWSSRQL
jgi:hypothetical protein